MTPNEMLAKYQPREGKPLTPAVQLATVRWGRCGKVLAAGTFDGRVLRWDATGDPPKELPALAGHDGWVSALACHSDGKRLFAADSWGRLCCWPYADTQPKPLWQHAAAHEGWVRRLALSPDGTRLASCGADGVVRLWATEDGAKIAELLQGEDTHAVAFHPDGKSLVAGDLRGVVRCWNVSTRKVAKTFDAKSMYLLERLQDVGGVRCLGFDTAGKVLWCGGGVPTSGGFVQGTYLILGFDWDTGKAIHTFKGANDNQGYVFDLTWHPAGFVMAVCSGQPGSGKLFFQRPDDPQPFFDATKMPNCHALDVHPDGSRFVVAATNANSAGNGRVKGKGGAYPTNVSPLHLWTLPRPG